MNENPYASPQVSLEPTLDRDMPRSRQPLASQGKRFLNFVIDNVILQVLYFAVGIVIGVGSVILNGSPITQENQSSLEAVSIVACLLVMLLYYAVTEAAFQRTP